MVSFLFFISSKNELPSCFSNNWSAGIFNVGRVNLDGISKTWVNVIGFDPITLKANTEPFTETWLNIWVFLYELIGSGF